MKKLGMILLSIMLVSGLFLSCSKDNESIKWVLVPAADAEAELEKYQPIANFISEKIGKNIEMFVSSDYSTAVTSLKTGDSQIARLTPFSVALASTIMDVEPIVRGVKKSTGLAAYKSIIVVRKDSEVKSIDDLKDKTFVYTDEGSTSGNLVPLGYFTKEGIIPDEFFSETFYSGGHDASILAVKNKKVDAASVADHRLQRMHDSGVIDINEFRIIYTSGPLPTSPICVNSNMDKELKESIINAFLKVPEKLASNAVGGLSHYEETSFKDYEYIKDLGITLDLLND